MNQVQDKCAKKAFNWARLLPLYHLGKFKFNFLFKPRSISLGNILPCHFRFLKETRFCVYLYIISILSISDAWYFILQTFLYGFYIFNTNIKLFVFESNVSKTVTSLVLMDLSGLCRQKMKWTDIIYFWTFYLTS